jgi:hypothetical protein
MTQHLAGGARAEHVGVIDMTATGDDRMGQGEDLAARSEPADPAHETDVASISASRSKPAAIVADKIRPALATSDSSSKSTTTRSKRRDTRLTESASPARHLDDFRHRHRGCSGRLSRGGNRAPH